LSAARIILHPRTGEVVITHAPWPCASPPPPLRSEEEWEAHIALGALATHRGTVSPASVELTAAALPLVDAGGAYADIRVRMAEGCGASYSVSTPLERRATVWVGPSVSSLESHRAMLVETAGAAAPVTEALWSPGSGLVFALRGEGREPPALHLVVEVSVGVCGAPEAAAATVGVAHLTPAILAAAALGDPSSSSSSSGIRQRGEAALPVVDAGALRGHITVRWSFVRGCSPAVLCSSARDGPSVVPPAFWRAGGVWGHRGCGMDGAVPPSPDTAGAVGAPYRRQHVAENSLDALTLAAPLGASCAEFDVQVCAPLAWGRSRRRCDAPPFPPPPTMCSSHGTACPSSTMTGPCCCPARRRCACP
jgi:hypothetical protein